MDGERWHEERQNSERRQGRDMTREEVDDGPRTMPRMPPSTLTPEEEAANAEAWDRMVWGYRR